MTMTPLLPWEARLIRRLSEIYVSSVGGYDNKTVQSPVDMKAPQVGIKSRLKSALLEVNS